jgi:hypothetical protein
MNTLSRDAVAVLSGLQRREPRDTTTTSPERERWIFTLELPSGIDHGGRFVARILKHLLRAWGVRAVAIHAPAPEERKKPKWRGDEE